MDEEKEIAVEKLLNLIRANANIDDLVNVFVYGYLESCPSANKLIHEANLSKTELYALIGDQDRYIDKLQSEMDLEEGEQRYVERD